MKRYSYIIILFLGLICSVTKVNAQRHDAYISLMAQADSAIAAEEWGSAERNLLEALRLEPANPSNVILMSNLGMVRFYQGDDSLAVATLNDAHAMAPNAVVVLSNRASVFAALGEYDKAYDDWGRILEIDSLHTTSRYLHAMEALRRGAVGDADRDVEMLRRYAPDDHRTDLAVGTFYTATGRYSEAIPALNHAIEAAPSPELYTSRALCRIMNNELNEASEDIAAGLELDPSDAELYLYRGLLNKLRYRNDDARRDALRAVELGMDPNRAAPLLK